MSRKMKILSHLNEINKLYMIIGEAAIKGDMTYGVGKNRDNEKELGLDEDRPAKKHINMGSPEDDEKLCILQQEVLQREDEIKIRMIGDDEQALQERLKREIAEESKGKSNNDQPNNPLSLKDKVTDRVE